MENVTDTTQRQTNSPNNRENRVRFTQESSAGTLEPQSHGLAKFRANITIALLPPVTMKSHVEHYVFEYLRLKSSLARLEKI
jgi:hypothetical protein